MDPNSNHESFKGALYLIGMNRKHRLMLKPDWDSVAKLWTAFFKTKLSEKLSIVHLLESIIDGINNEFQTIATEIFISDEIANFGANMIKNEYNLPENFLEDGNLRLKKWNEKNKKIYFSLIDEILQYSHENSLHWRYHLICSSLIHNLAHPVSKYSSDVTKVYVKNLIHDSVDERNLAIRICMTGMQIVD